MANNTFKPLKGINIVSLALNVPGPVAANRLQNLGATVTKIEPPAGDPLVTYCPEWYRSLTNGQKVLRLDLKNSEDQANLFTLFEQTNLFITSMRPNALERLGLGWNELHLRFTHLSHLAIVGYPKPDENIAGHDLTYQAALGLLSPPELPRTLMVDLGTAENAVSTALAQIMMQKEDGQGNFAQISIHEIAERFAAPLRYGLTQSEGLLGGGCEGYNLYQTANGWIALAALEPQFWQRIVEELNLKVTGKKELQSIFLTRTSAEWETWAKLKDIPLTSVTG